MTQIQTLERRGRRLFVNGQDTRLWTEHTWQDIWTRELMEAWQRYLLEIDATTDRLWWWPEEFGGLQRTLRYQHAKWCVENGIVPQVMAFQRYTWGGGPQWDPQSLGTGDKRELNALLDDLAGLPYILEIGNELLYTSFQREAVGYLRDQGFDGLIAVNTGRNGPVQSLEGIGADIVYATPGYQPQSRQVIVGWDSDHMSKTALHGSKLSSLSYWIDDLEESGYDAKIAMVMRAWCDESGSPCSLLTGNYTKPVNDPNNRHFKPARLWLQDRIGNQIEDPAEPPSPPPPSPPPPGLVTYELSDFLFPAAALVGTRIGNLSTHRIANRGALVKDAPPVGTAMDWIALLSTADGPHWCWVATEEDPWSDDKSYKPNMNPSETRMGPKSFVYDPSRTPHKLWEYTTDRVGTMYQEVRGCQEVDVRDLTGAHYEVWGVYPADHPGLESWRKPIGGVIPGSTETIALAAYYGSLGPPYPVKEEWIFCRGYGEVLWIKYQWNPSTQQYEEVQRSAVNNYFNGPAVPPSFPCKPEWLDPNYTLTVMKGGTDGLHRRMD